MINPTIATLSKQLQHQNAEYKSERENIMPFAQYRGFLHKIIWSNFFLLASMLLAMHMFETMSFKFFFFFEGANLIHTNSVLFWASKLQLEEISS